jgi:hypothetical protein
MLQPTFFLINLTALLFAIDLYVHLVLLLMPPNELSNLTHLAILLLFCFFKYFIYFLLLTFVGFLAGLSSLCILHFYQSPCPAGAAPDVPCPGALGMVACPGLLKLPGSAEPSTNINISPHHTTTCFTFISSVLLPLWLN